MRREFIALVAGLAALAGLAGCGHPPLSGTPAQAASTTQTAAPDTTSSDPYAFKDVPYADYREAAQQLSIPTGLLISATGFSESLSTLCHSSPDDFTKLVTAQRTKAGSDSDGASTLQSMTDEVQLRLSLSCPQRMGDWAASRADDQSYDAGNEVSDTASPTPTAGADGDQSSMSSHDTGGSDSSDSDSTPSPTASSASAGRIGW